MKDRLIETSNQLDTDIQKSGELSSLLARYIQSLENAIKPWQSGVERQNVTQSLMQEKTMFNRSRISGNVLIDTQYLKYYSTKLLTKVVLQQIDQSVKHHFGKNELDDPQNRHSGQLADSLTVKQQALAACAGMCAAYLALGLNERWTLDKICHRRLSQSLAPGLSLEVYGASTVCRITVSGTSRLVSIGKLGFDIFGTTIDSYIDERDAFLNKTQDQLSAAIRHCEVFSKDLEADRINDQSIDVLSASDHQRYELIRKVVRQYQAQADLFRGDA